MNTTELKALAEAVKGWKLRDVLQTPDDKDEGIAFVGHQSDVGIFDDIVHIDTGNYMQPQMAIVIANYYAAANPAAMLAMIADLESAQDERRALLATEQNLRERVKALEEGLADSTQSLCWLAFGECRNITGRPLLTALQVEASARALLEKTT